MRAVIQRVKRTALRVNGSLISQIDGGLAVYLGVSPDDTEKNAAAMAKKIVNLRIFEDGQGKMNLSVQDVGGEILLISQFTLYGDCSHGNRPSFIGAARPEQAEPLYRYTAECLRGYNVSVKTGVFGADMKIEQYNDGPVTILYEC
ncbi:MAG TPA: D-tyrosyl-tRNA(Tyr) deacylase [Candidatus Borkfalkia excrementigallinarum]|uniref:D-aminoacyl-tRNA deacylase n=1 Tax=Candidatus Borkfalkia excrementigallinarum TaxID=2838506 RepID=A0A9D1ZV46_9FIRM|nr:D-tyrosyl-tRNA(Tyr) deacylase [Candidatus Borkfalkia excrementigallinarum]